MRGLASYVMSGRYRALLVAVASSGSLLFGWIGAAVVALVTLRRGVQQGTLLLLWASLPALVLAQITGDSSTVALLVGTALLAMVLRLSVSLPVTALFSVAVAVITGVALLAFGERLLDELVRVFEEFFAAVAAQAQRDGTSIELRAPTRLQLAGMMGTANGGLSFLCLALARYWQAALYNPGGFGEEFRALRFPPALVVVLLLGALALGSAGFSYRSWAAALLLPLTIGGFALLHARARQRGRGRGWLGAAYVLWAVFDVAKLALLGVVLADAVWDFRGRAAAVKNGEKDGKEEPRRLDDNGDTDSRDRNDE